MRSVRMFSGAVVVIAAVGLVVTAAMLLFWALPGADDGPNVTESGEGGPLGAVQGVVHLGVTSTMTHTGGQTVTTGLDVWVDWSGQRLRVTESDVTGTVYVTRTAVDGVVESTQLNRHQRNPIGWEHATKQLGEFGYAMTGVVPPAAVVGTGVVSGVNAVLISPQGDAEGDSGPVQEGWFRADDLLPLQLRAVAEGIAQQVITYEYVVSETVPAASVPDSFFSDAAPVLPSATIVMSHTEAVAFDEFAVYYLGEEFEGYPVTGYSYHREYGGLLQQVHGFAGPYDIFGVDYGGEWNGPSVYQINTIPLDSPQSTPVADQTPVSRNGREVYLDSSGAASVVMEDALVIVHAGSMAEAERVAQHLVRLNAEP